MSGTRRKFFQEAVIFSAGLLGFSSSLRAQEGRRREAGGAKKQLPHQAQVAEPHAPLPMVTPDVPDLPYQMDGPVKVFRLRAEPVKKKIAPFKIIDTWGYNGSCPGPTIQVNQGDRVRVVFENRLPESTSMHWHGIELPIEQDGVPYISHKPIAPGETYVYEFTVHQEGTFFYHAHSAMQEMIGQLGFFIAHPEKSHNPHADHDYGIVLQEWAVLPSNSVPNTAAMEYNWLTFNGVSAPMTTPLIARLGSRVRLRFVNLGMDHHPIHLHGNQFVLTGTEGGRAPESTWYPMNTVLVGVAQARVVEFEAKYPGAWMIHCHLPHHMMNSMSDLLRDRAIQTADQSEAKAMRQMQTLAKSVPFEHVHPAPVAENANSVPGFPQDAFMEMAMDEVVRKPETHGLPPNWSAGMMGMMTMVRVLPDKDYDEIVRQKKNAAPSEKTEPHNHS
ncbi:MAG TPA: copper oxidase [Candidatus Saccharimonadales bacterium]|nr:copper oxidase [Candidatus Saccharimonadales bacterium]